MVAATDSAEQTLAIGEVAETSRISASTIRYYERRGLLPAPQRRSGRRRYDARILQLLRVIEVSKGAGFSLEEIEQLLHGFDPRTPPSERWQELVSQKLSEVDALIARAEEMRALLTRGQECGCLALEECRLVGARPQRTGRGCE
jgi:MerR family redox-sensitive transcriptional activator SoxR